MIRTDRPGVLEPKPTLLDSPFDGSVFVWIEIDERDDHVAMPAPESPGPIEEPFLEVAHKPIGPVQQGLEYHPYAFQWE